jgi:hypothetical protein
MFSKIPTLLLLIILLCLSPSLAQNQSLFLEDTCAPPCWFGLTAGESTVAELEALIAQYPTENLERHGQFDEASGLLIRGIYLLTMQLSETMRIYLYIEIRDSIVDLLNLSLQTEQSPEYISMQSALDHLGEADLIYAYDEGAFFGHDSFHLTFIYLESRLRIEFDYHPQPRTGCQLPTIREQMIVSRLSYFSPTAAQVLERHPNRDELQPALTAFHVNESLVLAVDWRAVLNGEIQTICRIIPAERNFIDTAPLIYTEPSVPESFFEGDTCAPPCWFGLTAGESSVEDVLVFIENSDLLFRDWLIHPDSIFDEATGLMQTGTYYNRHWLFANLDYGGSLVSVSLRITDGILSSIFVAPNQFVLLHEVLSKLGSPDIVFIDYQDTTGATLEFIYEDLALSIRFRSIWSNCQLGRMSNQFWVDSISYLEQSAIQDKISSIYYYSSDNVVAPEIWQQWLRGEIESSCRTAWRTVLDA